MSFLHRSHLPNTHDVFGANNWQSSSIWHCEQCKLTGSHLDKLLSSLHVELDVQFLTHYYL